jgi:mRNA interferase HicA
MKRRDLERQLTALGWEFLRHGSNHDIWMHRESNQRERIPRHRDVNEALARKILEKARRANDEN